MPKNQTKRTRILRKKLDVDFLDRDALVGSTLRRRDALLSHRKKCGKLVLTCPKCALLNLHEKLADLKFAIQHARSAKIPSDVVFREMLGVVAGGV